MTEKLIALLFAAALASRLLSARLLKQHPSKLIPNNLRSGRAEHRFTTMSGRVAAIDAVHEGQRLTVYIGAASGGVWKSVNGGSTFKPVFDKQAVQSIGAITIDPSNPRTVWVGTGESWMRTASRLALAFTSRRTAVRTGPTWA